MPAITLERVLADSELPEYMGLISSDESADGEQQSLLMIRNFIRERPEHLNGQLEQVSHEHMPKVNLDEISLQLARISIKYAIQAIETYDKFEPLQIISNTLGIIGLLRSEDRIDYVRKFSVLMQVDSERAPDNRIIPYANERIFTAENNRLQIEEKKHRGEHHLVEVEAKAVLDTIISYLENKLDNGPHNRDYSHASSVSYDECFQSAGKLNIDYITRISSEGDLAHQVSIFIQDHGLPIKVKVGGRRNEPENHVHLWFGGNGQSTDIKLKYEKGMGLSECIFYDALAKKVYEKNHERDTSMAIQKLSIIYESLEAAK